MGFDDEERSWGVPMFTYANSSSDDEPEFDWKIGSLA